jgi:hypothetical protein
MAEEVDASQRVSGFSFVSIKGALTLVGIMGERDDVQTVRHRLTVMTIRRYAS